MSLTLDNREVLFIENVENRVGENVCPWGVDHFRDVVSKFSRPPQSLVIVLRSLQHSVEREKTEIEQRFSLGYGLRYQGVLFCYLDDVTLVSISLALEAGDGAVNLNLTASS